MSNVHHFYSEANYGDNMEQLNFMRHLAAKYPDHEFIHYPKDAVRDQLDPFIDGVPNISIRPLAERPEDALCSWIGFEGFVFRHPSRAGDRVGFLVAWFKRVAERAGLESPVTGVDQLLFDYPSLYRAPAECDILVVNSAPQSGQLRTFSPERLGNLALDLSAKHSVITTEKVENLHCTRDWPFSLAQIGAMSVGCKAVVGVATGPIWPTMNVLNHGKTDFIYMVDNEHINYGDKYIKAIDDHNAREILTQRGYL